MIDLVERRRGRSWRVEEVVKLRQIGAILLDRPRRGVLLKLQVGDKPIDGAFE
jgi:hypothetical protein